MPGDCHYLEGNVNAKRRIEYARSLLDRIGIEPDRLQMFNLSAAMAGEFVRITKEMTEKIEGLGPNPLKKRSGSKPEDQSKERAA